MNSMVRIRDGLFGPGKFYKNALSIAVPIMLQQLIQSMVSLVDNFMVSGLGDVAMSGVNVAGQIIFVFMVYVNTICMAGGIFMTQYFGAGDKNGMAQAFRFKLVMLFVLARYTNVGPVTMYFVIKLLDLVKVVIFHIWLRKERWLKNLTVPQAA